MELSCRRLDDRDLITQAQSGDPDAMHELMALIRRAVLGYCRSRLGRYAGGLDAADDVVQETCVAIYSVLPKYEHQGAPFSAWMYAIAANKVADAQRRAGRSGAVLVEDIPDQIEPSPTPEDLVMTTALVEAVSELIDQLPDKMRQVLLLKADGATAELIGRRFDMKPGAVRVLQHRAAAKLRKLVTESEEHRELLGAARPLVPVVPAADQPLPCVPHGATAAAAAVRAPVEPSLLSA